MAGPRDHGASAAGQPRGGELGPAVGPLARETGGRPGPQAGAGAGRAGHGGLRGHLAFPQPQIDPGSEGAGPLLRQPLRFGAGGGGIRGQGVPATQCRNNAVARHLVRFDPAALVPRPHAAERVDPGHFHMLPFPRWALLGVGRRRLLRRHVQPRLALRPGGGAAVSRAGANPPRTGRFRPGAAAQRRYPLPRREQRRSGGRRAGRLHPPRLPRTPGQRRLPPSSRASGQR